MRISDWSSDVCSSDLLQTVDLPVQRPTMIALGGSDLKTAFVTSAGKALTDEARADQPHAGGLFTFRVDVPGLPGARFEIGRASCRERGCQDVSILVVAVALKKNTKILA